MNFKNILTHISSLWTKDALFIYIVYSWLMKDIMKENFYEALLANTEKTVPG